MADTVKESDCERRRQEVDNKLTKRIISLEKRLTSVQSDITGKLDSSLFSMKEDLKDISDSVKRLSEFQHNNKESLIRISKDIERNTSDNHRISEEVKEIKNSLNAHIEEESKTRLTKQSFWTVVIIFLGIVASVIGTLYMKQDALREEYHKDISDIKSEVKDVREDNIEIKSIFKNSAEISWLED